MAAKTLAEKKAAAKARTIARNKKNARTRSNAGKPGYDRYGVKLKGSGPKKPTTSTSTTKSTGRKVDARSIKGQELREKKADQESKGKSTFYTNQAARQLRTNTGKSAAAKRARERAAARRKAGRLSQRAILEDPTKVDGVKIPVKPVKNRVTPTPTTPKVVPTPTTKKKKKPLTRAQQSRADNRGKQIKKLEGRERDHDLKEPVTPTKPKKKFTPLSAREQRKAQRQRKKYDRNTKKAAKATAKGNTRKAARATAKATKARSKGTAVTKGAYKSKKKK